MRPLRYLILLALLSASPAAFSRTLVVIASAAAPEQSIDAIGVRKLFLGLPVTADGAALHPLRNLSDATIQAAFLQYVVAMSESAYDRRMLSMLNTRGQPRPPEFSSVSALLERLSADPRTVSYAWQEDVAADSRIKVLRVLWRE